METYHIRGLVKTRTIGEMGEEGPLRADWAEYSMAGTLVGHSPLDRQKGLSSQNGTPASDADKSPRRWGLVRYDIVPEVGYIPNSASNTVRSANLTDHILTAVGVRNAENALRVIMPFAIYYEAVAMLSRGQLHRRHPDSVLAFLHRNAALLPVSKITNQQHAHGGRCGETKRLLRGDFHLRCHTPLSFPELRFLIRQQWPCGGTPLPLILA